MFGLAQIKEEGCGYIHPIEAVEDDIRLPYLPKICKAVWYGDKRLTRKEYTKMYILEQPFA